LTARTVSPPNREIGEAIARNSRAALLCMGFVFQVLPPPAEMNAEAG